ncbi:MAG: T9SS type A sorting domain-containing protein [Candidatus Electryonea clarkiae]|nr:T9SS type A sorting domain-containing protein [Candidatus Electryonea clarkiae]MDP8285323.1 T9SS type A sorting domain-containing protein [Candidatus Electryonea clarkiae]
MKNLLLRFSVFLLLFLPQSMLARDSLNVRSLAKLCLNWGGASNVVVEDNYAFVMADNAGHRIVDISNLENPVEEGYFRSQEHATLEYYATDIALDGNIAYAVHHIWHGWYAASSINVLDLTNPEYPEVLANIDFDGGITDLQIVDSLLFLTDRGSFEVYGPSFLRIFDISNPAELEEIGMCSTGVDLHRIIVSGEYAYICGHGLLIIDISDPENPIEVCEWRQGGYRNDIAISGNYAFVVGINEQGKTLDISDPENPVEIDTFEIGRNPLIYIDGDYAYVTHEGQNLLKIFDISDPQDVQEIACLEMPYRLWKIQVIDGILFAPAGGLGLRILDISSPDSLVEIGYLSKSGYASDIKFYDNMIYTANSLNGLRVFDVFDPEIPIDIGFRDTDAIVYHVEVGDRMLFTIGRSSPNSLITFRIIDISDTLDINEISSTEVGNHEYPPFTKFDILDNYAFIANSNELIILNIEDYNNPIVVSETENSGWQSFSDIAVQGNYAFITGDRFGYDGYDGLYVVDFSNMHQPEIVGFCQFNSDETSIFVTEDYAFIANLLWYSFIEEESSFKIIDINDPSEPFILSSVETLGWPQDIVVEGDYAFLTEQSGSTRNDYYEGGLLVFDISDPEEPELVGHYETNGDAQAIDIDNNTIYLADGYFVEILEFDPEMNTAEIVAEVPDEYLLLDPYPNPFNSITVINLILPQQSNLNISIYNIVGQKVVNLVSGNYTPGNHKFGFDASEFSSGIYFIHASVPGKLDEVRKVVLVR